MPWRWPWINHAYRITCILLMNAKRQKGPKKATSMTKEELLWPKNGNTEALGTIGKERTRRRYDQRWSIAEDNNCCQWATYYASIMRIMPIKATNQMHGLRNSTLRWQRCMTRGKKKTTDQMCSEWQDLKMMQTLHHKKKCRYKWGYWTMWSVILSQLRWLSMLDHKESQIKTR